MEMLRCPICFALLVEEDPARCPSCHKRLKGRWRRRPVLLGQDTKITSQKPSRIDLARLERREAAGNAPQPEPAVAATASAPMITSPPWVSPPEYKAPVADPAPEPVVEAPPIVEATPLVEATPVIEAPPVVEAPPVLVEAPPIVEVPPAAEAPLPAPTPIQRTAMFEPSQFDPEMRELLDGLYRKARAELRDEETK